MSITRRRCAALAVGLGVGLVARPALANLQFTPILVDLQPGQRSALLEISNRGATPMSLQARPFAWSQSGLEDRLVPSEDLLLSPPIFTIGPAETQVLRLVLRAGPWAGPGERAWRLLLDELPDRSGGAQQGLRVVLRVSLPVFAQPPRPPAEAQLRWRVERAGREALLVAQNLGERRARFMDVTAAPPRGRPTTLRLASENHYALPGGERRWALPESVLRAVPAGGTLTVATSTEGGPVEAAVPVPR